VKILQPSEVKKLSREEADEVYSKLYAYYIKIRNSMAQNVLDAAKKEIQVVTLKEQQKELREIASFLRGETDFRELSLGAKLTMRYLISVKHEWDMFGKNKETEQMVLNFINAELLLKNEYPEDLKDIKLFLKTGGRRVKSWRIQWQAWEDEIVMDDSLTNIQKAYMTGRSYSAVQRRCHVLKWRLSKERGRIK
jgi:hypothetical protein